MPSIPDMFLLTVSAPLTLLLVSVVWWACGWWQLDKMKLIESNISRAWVWAI